MDVRTKILTSAQTHVLDMKHMLNLESVDSCINSGNNCAKTNRLKNILEAAGTASSCQNLQHLFGDTKNGGIHIIYEVHVLSTKHDNYYSILSTTS